MLEKEQEAIVSGIPERQKYIYPSTADASKLSAGESIDSRAIYSSPADSICCIDDILHVNF